MRDRYTCMSATVRVRRAAAAAMASRETDWCNGEERAITAVSYNIVVGVVAVGVVDVVVVVVVVVAVAAITIATGSTSALELWISS